jgi:hypothetical protein
VKTAGGVDVRRIFHDAMPRGTKETAQRGIIERYRLRQPWVCVGHGSHPMTIYVV